MNKLLKITIFSTLLNVSGFALAETKKTTTKPLTGKLEVLRSASKVTWLGKKVTGEHTGNITLKKGSLDWQDGKLVGGEFVMDMSTITVTDIQGEYNTKLVTHLNSPDFFDVTKHPEAQFKITKAEKKADNQYELAGDLTIKGKAQPATLNATVTEKDQQLIGTGKLVFNRTLFDIRYGSGKFFDNLGDKAINDDVELDLLLVAVKK
jgi:polyisoprenoid-binding protein YceI